MESPPPILLVVMLCCCFRFRIPRTKQDIEADYQRRILSKKFREKLEKIKNTEMENMDLSKALERIQSEILLDQYAQSHGADNQSGHSVVTPGTPAVRCTHRTNGSSSHLITRAA